MPYEVKLPDIGEGVAEGEIVRWLVRPGDLVREEQPLVEVMTDKASVEIPSPRAGTIAALNVERGEVRHGGRAPHDRARGRCGRRRGRRTGSGSSGGARGGRRNRG